MKRYCLTTEQGTACPETVLCVKHFTYENRQLARKERWKDALDIWTDCSGNELCKCIICGG